MNLKRLTPLILLILLALLVFNNVLQNKSPDADVPKTAEKARASATVSTLPPTSGLQSPPSERQEAVLDEDGEYDSAEEVALYLHTFQRLPANYITKQEARALGWSGGDLRPYAKGRTIGGDRFGNYEGLLPAKKGRVYYECDIDTLGQASRGAKRIVYSNDGLIYYTEDHYASFTKLYGEE